MLVEEVNASAFAIIELLNKHGFKVNISTLQKPDMNRIERIFGEEESNYGILIRSVS